MHVLIFANGELFCPEQARGLVQEVDVVLCADGGMRHARALGLYPHAVIGDMDSLPPNLRDELSVSGTEFIVHPSAKDETDLELALLYAVDRGATRITVLGARGGRMDHELGNLFLLVHPRLEGIDVRIRTGRQEAVLVRHRATFSGAPGDLLSLLPIGGDASGITTVGLQYALNDDVLYFGPARGVSNVFTISDPVIVIRSGLLLAVHTRVFLV